MFTSGRSLRFGSFALAALAATLAVAPAASAKKKQKPAAAPAAAAAPAPAPAAPRAKVRNADRAFKISHPLPFKLGEKLVFDVKFARFPVNASVGQVTFSVSEPGNSKQHVKFEVEAVSKGALTSLFNVDVQDTFTTLADRDDLFVYSSVKNLREGKTRTRQEAVYNRQDRSVRYTVTNAGDAAQAPVVTTAETKPWVLDAVATLYFARTRKLLNEGREVAFYVHDEAKSYHVGIALLGREQIKTDVGTFKTIKVDARIFNGRYVRREGSLVVWLTDDARRIPVKAQIKIPAGTVTFELERLEEGTEPNVAAGRNVAGGGGGDAADE